MGFSIFGGSSDPKTYTTSTSQTISSPVSAVDNKVVDGENVNVGGNFTLSLGASPINAPIDISQTDYGAISAATQITSKAFDTLKEETAVQSQITRDAIDRSTALAAQASRTESSLALEKFTKYGAIVIVVGLIGSVIVKSFGRK